MPHYIALLRGINVGGHKIIKMETLRALLSDYGLRQVTTYIQSGNVLFEAPGAAASLTQGLEAHLAQALGYPVTLFLRTPAALRALVAQNPFKDRPLPAGSRLYVAFLAAPLTSTQQKAVLAHSTAVDELACGGREVFSLCHKQAGKSLFSNALLEKTLKVPATTRDWNTVLKLVALCGAAEK